MADSDRNNFRLRHSGAFNSVYRTSDITEQKGLLPQYFRDTFNLQKLHNSVWKLFCIYLSNIENV